MADGGDGPTDVPADAALPARRVPADVVSRLVRALDRAPSTVITLLEPDLTIAWASSSSEWVTGHDAEAESGSSGLEHVHPEDIRRLVHGFDQLAAASRRAGRWPADLEPFRYRVRRPDGRWVVLESVLHNLVHDPHVRGILVESRRVDTGLDGVGSVVDLLVDEAPLADVLAACARLIPPYVGSAAVVAQVDGRSVSGTADTGEAGVLASDPRWWRDAVEKGETVAPDAFAGFPGDLAARARSMGFRTAWASPLTDRSTGEVTGCIVVLVQIDVTFDLAADGNLRQAKRIAGLAIAEERRRVLLQRQAATDPLTGLGNRSALRRRLDTAAGDVTLVAIDLDAFKPVNDAYGHSTGDAVLQVVAERLHAVVREDDLVVRYGGDEFAVVLAPDAPEAAVDSLVRRVVGALEAPIVVGPLTLRVGASVGVATAPPDEVVHQADAALYQAKRSKRDGQAARI
jgi:diguanylate cyclase (GGDEF)-like protein